MSQTLQMANKSKISSFDQQVLGVNKGLLNEDGNKSPEVTKFNIDGSRINTQTEDKTKFTINS